MPTAQITRRPAVAMQAWPRLGLMSSGLCYQCAFTDTCSLSGRANVYVSGASAGSFISGYYASGALVNALWEATSADEQQGQPLVSGSIRIVVPMDYASALFRPRVNERHEYDVDQTAIFEASHHGSGVFVSGEKFEMPRLTAADFVREAVLADSMSSMPVQRIKAWARKRMLASALAKEFIARLSSAAAEGEDDAIETVYDRIHRLIDAEEYAAIDEALETLNVRRHLASVLLSILTITAMSTVMARLIHRAGFYARTKEWLVLREGRQAAEELLLGLE